MITFLNFFSESSMFWYTVQYLHLKPRLDLFSNSNLTFQYLQSIYIFPIVLFLDTVLQIFCFVDILNCLVIIGVK